ncbi:hypothetical protein FACS1894188_03040 [Clostridia bacterium]|nr:hypothetical protein FACS1894188_03040 [Clostridia bacterium]
MKFKQLVLLIMLCFLTSCYGLVDLEDRGYVLSLCIDKDGGNYKLSMTTADIQESGGKENGEILHGNGKTLSDAFADADLHTDKKLYYGHTSVLIIGESLRKDTKMFGELCDELAENTDISQKMYVFSAKTAEGILTEKDKDISLGMYVVDYYKSHKQEPRLRVGELVKSPTAEIPRFFYASK